jgi:hypothetical protein
MKAKIIFINHDDEAIERAEKLGMAAPEPTRYEGEVFFNVEYVSIAYVNAEGEMVVYFPSGPWVLEYDNKTWLAIKKHLMQ